MAKILVIDDDHEICNLLVQRLKANNFHVATASTILESFQQLSQEVPDVIILDFMLPGILGTTFSEDLKKDTQYQEIPIIFVSGQSEEEIKKMDANVRFDAYIRKPFEAQDLIQTIHKVLSN
ncbi:MAG: response regulator [Candidatus Omnitrophica bacterium]|nr:response regulator [Candidatus Omnitrophota bacterium]